MIVVFAIDGFEYNLVERFGCKNLKQKFYGKTDISEFSQPRTMVLWSSFMTGENKENEVIADGNKEMWNKKWDIKETFFSEFKEPIVLDLPGFSYNLNVHERSRNLLKQFFETKDKGKKEDIRREYKKDAFDHHRKIKKEFFKALDENHDFVLGYFSVADVIGHLDLGNNIIMKMIYKELDEIAKNIKSNKLIVLSDHGMKAIGMFGDHSEYGFWSTNFKDLERPRITGFAGIVGRLKNES